MSAPAGDGGLREALERLVTERRSDDGNDLIVFPAELSALLTDHPAAPAVPQPVDREAPTREQIAEAVAAAWVPLDVGCEKIVDAVMAVLAGEQEQVEP